MKDQPAFPVTERQEHADGQIVCVESKGLSIRQWYAGMVLQGLMSQDRLQLQQFSFEDKKIDWEKLIAARCWDIADAMLLHEQTEEPKE